MFSRRLKTGYFILEGLNSFVVVYYLYYFYFFMRHTYGFDNKANLVLAACNGAISAVAAFFGGKFAQRFGYFAAIKLGFALMLAALTAGLLLSTAGAQVTVMAVTVIGMCFTWPALEAMVSEGESRAGVQQMLGVYNVIWASTAAAANFSGGAMLHYLGQKSLFFVPMTLLTAQLLLTFWLEAQAHLGTEAPRKCRENKPGPGHATASAQLQVGALEARGTRTAIASLGRTHMSPAPSEEHPCSPARARTFQRMAWLANPFAYIAINTLVALIPGIADHLKLSTTVAGFCCSVWCFARLGAFTALWFWAGWHYRFRWLLLAYVALVGSFAAILLWPGVAMLVGAQLLFGLATGLIYYSSLFYSMDISETKGEHGGIHESAIGLGNFAGPAVGAAALQFAPQWANSGTLAVTGLLVCGLCGVAAIWRAGTRAGGFSRRTVPTCK
jgi:MFS family permease